MTLKTKNKILMALTLFLLAVNITAITSIFLHLRAEKQMARKTAAEQPAHNYQGRYRAQGNINYKKMKLIEEKLQLDAEQSKLFRQIYKNHLVVAHQKFDSIKILRSQINKELAEKNPDLEQIEFNAERIGNLHKDLTMNQVEMFLEMAQHCDDAQRDSLYQIYLQYQKPPRRWHKGPHYKRAQ